MQLADEHRDALLAEALLIPFVLDRIQLAPEHLVVEFGRRTAGIGIEQTLTARCIERCAAG